MRNIMRMHTECNFFLCVFAVPDLREPDAGCRRYTGVTRARGLQHARSKSRVIHTPRPYQRGQLPPQPSQKYPRFPSHARSCKETTRAKNKVWNARDLERARSIPPPPKPSKVLGSEHNAAGGGVKGSTATHRPPPRGSISGGGSSRSLSSKDRARRELDSWQIRFEPPLRFRQNMRRCFLFSWGAVLMYLCGSFR